MRRWRKMENDYLQRNEKGVMKEVGVGDLN